MGGSAECSALGLPQPSRPEYALCGIWCTYRRSQYEQYSLAVTSDGKVGP